MAKYPTPNLLLATTYALNASNSKRVVAGLEWHGGFFRPVVKFCGNNSASPPVTLDDVAWELFYHQQEPINHYFAESTQQLFGKPSLFNLNSAEIFFTNCYGSKTLVITQPTPEEPVRDLRFEEKFNAQVPADAARIEEPAAKKQKGENPPTIAMHASTYYGLRDLLKCIDLRMEYLEEQRVLVNRVVDQIIDFLKEEMLKCIDAEVKNSLIDYNCFKKYFSLKKKEMFSSILKSTNFFNVNQNNYEIIFEEISAFGLQPIAKFLYKELCEK